MSKRHLGKSLVLSLSLMCTAATGNAGNGNNGCKGLPDYQCAESGARGGHGDRDQRA
jgi:hypothetical protein